jgi:hypothetical protein
MKNKFIKTGLLMSALALMVSCNDNEATGDSVLVPSSPTLSVALGFTANQNLVEVDKDYTFTVSLSEPQIVDVNVKLEQVAGTATDGEDFDIPHIVKIKAGTTSATATISLHADELIEETETATIRIGTGLESNVQAVNSADVNFTIGNLTADDLVASLSWATQVPVTDHFGTDIPATTLLNLRLLLTSDPSKDNILDGANGDGFETFELDGTTPDGTYYLVADFYNNDNIPVDLSPTAIDLTLQFDQTGTINGQVMEFPGALSTDFSCAAGYYTLVKVIKTGGSYEIVNSGASPTSLNPSPYVGSWSGQGSWFDSDGYTSEVVTTIDANGDMWINGLTFGWFQDWWGEVIVTSTPVKVTFVGGEGDFVIAEQPYIESTWNGAAQPAYSIKATGKLSPCSQTMEIYPVLIQGGSDIDGSAWGDVFVENIKLD